MNFEYLCRPLEHRMSRRQWLGGVAGAAVGALGLGGLAQPAVAQELKKKHRQVLFIWLDGGISQLESWDPKPNTQFGGPFRAIPTSVPGIHISELLPKTARQMHHLALVRSLCTKDNSHSAGVARIQRGDPKNRGVTYPYFGSAVAKLLGPGDSGLPPYVWVKPGSGGFVYQDAGFLGPRYGAVAFGDGKPPENLLLNPALTEADDEARNALRMKLDRRYAERRRKEWTEANSYVFDMAAQLRKQARLFDPSTLPPRDVERYGTHEFGRHMLLARRLLEAGVTFVKVNSYGWDTHGDNFNGHLSMVPKVDQAFAAMIEDLKDRGMLDNVLVIMMSEFGRTPRINGHVGRDHWPEAWSLVMAGCGLKRGVVVGKTNERGTHVTTEEHDIGHMFHTWFQALGINPKEHSYDNGGQPLPIAHEDCHAVTELLA
ncbi:MAG TPA: DUF1501 domain-containing protein [Gemmataceae bacterium]|nr:DUF1501 domain-containing protein [Gemmataceae bacterium]